MIGLGTPPSAPIRLAILEADEPLPIIKAVRGRFGAIFTLLLRAACESLDLPQTLDSQLSLSTYDVVAGDPDTAYPDPETIDAVLITGSRHSAFENHHWIIRLVEYTRRLLEGNRVRVIGVCFGHQITARALGAQIARSPNYWELSVTELELTEEGKRVFGADTLRIHQTHRDVVLEYPPGTVALAHSKQCHTQAMYIPCRLITVQGHPEFNDSMMRELLQARHSTGIIADGPFEDAMMRAADKHDGVAIARVFLRFLRE